MTSSYFCEYPGARKTSAPCVSVRAHAAYVNQCARNSWWREGREGGRAEREEGREEGREGGREGREGGREGREGGREAECL